MLNLVHLDGRDWITDPGFGPIQIREPMPFEHGRIDTQDGQKFRMIDGGRFGTIEIGAPAEPAKPEKASEEASRRPSGRPGLDG